MRPSKTLLLILPLLISFLSSCEAIAGIFKAGMGFGIFIVVVVIIAIIAIVIRVNKKKA
jgi:tetrahydromethanopterin S-methyltransferase subunit B